jgi:acyl-[acyl-carrier-protein] desaturase
MKEQRLSPERKEVMMHIEQFVDNATDEYLVPIDKNWQPTDFLPKSNVYETFIKEIKELRESAQELSYDFWVVLVGDTITEEALPTYESWICSLDAVDLKSEKGWGNWVRRWTAEENRHGDLLNKYLYLSGKVDMKAMETSTQYLLADGMDIGANNDPYRTFMYTSFQELATNISHRRVATLAKKAGNDILAKICGVIAADEARHAKAYTAFIEKIFEVDPSEMLLAFSDMMKKKIVMPAHNLRELGTKIGDTFTHFSEAAQRLNVYTSEDYVQILEKLLVDWDISNITGLTGEAAKAQDYVMNLPDRLRRIIGRFPVSKKEYAFSWIT